MVLILSSLIDKTEPAEMQILRAECNVYLCGYMGVTPAITGVVCT